MSIARGLSRLGKILSTGPSEVALPDAFRNKLINGGFEIWQRGASQTSSGYGSDDRWENINFGSGKSHSRQEFSLGQSEVPGEPHFFSRTVVSSVEGAGHFCLKVQRIEDVRTLAGKRATLTFYAKADAARQMSVEVGQNFGTGGDHSPRRMVETRKVALTALWQKFSFVVALPAIEGETIGTNFNSCIDLLFWFDAGTDWDERTDSLGHQSGTFDIARVSLVEGDATAEADPFSPRHVQQELALCKRYYNDVETISGFHAANSSWSVFPIPGIIKSMRATPSLSTGPLSSGNEGLELVATPTVIASTNVLYTNALNDGSSAAARWLLLGSVRLDAEL